MNGDSDRMRWTKKANGYKPSPPSRQSSSRSPFALCDDEEEESNHSGAVTPSSRPLPDDARDLVVDDQELVEEARIRGRMRGEPQTQAPTHVYVHHEPGTDSPGEVEEEHEDSNVPGRGATSEEMKQEDMPGGEIIRKMEEVTDGPSNATRVATIETPYDEDNPWA